MAYTAKFPTEILQKRFLKEISALPAPLQAQIWEAVNSLQTHPRPFGRKLFKQLAPPVYLYTYAASYRIRIADHRVLYDVDDRTKTVWVFALRRRNEKTYR